MTSAGNTVSGQANPATYTYQYDGTGNVTGENIQLGGLDAAHKVVLTSTYDFNDNRTSLSANIGGKLSNDGTVSGGTPDFLNTYGYDNLGNLTSISQTGQGGNSVAPKYVALGYDADSRLLSVHCYSAGNSSDANPGDEVVAAAYTYNHHSQVTGITYTAQSGTLAAYYYSYDYDGRATDFYSRKDTSSPGQLYDLGGHALHL